MQLQGNETVSASTCNHGCNDLMLRSDFKLNQQLTGGSVRFRAAVIVQNDKNQLDSDGTAGQLAVDFEAVPKQVFVLSWGFSLNF